jgi:hypothetical protein
MADLSDVTYTLASLASAALYPNGTGLASLAGVTVTVAPGWPNAKQLSSIIASGAAMLTVYPMPGMDANTTRFLGNDPVALAAPVPSLTMTVLNNTVTVGGTIKAGEAAFIGVNRMPYSHGVLVTDTTATIAAALAALIPNATALGSVVTIGGTVFDLIAQVSAVVSLQAEIARQKRVFMLTAWCPSPTVRDALCKAVDAAFKAFPGRRILFADGSYGVIIYRGTLETDGLSQQKIFRRDLRYEVEYATTQQTSSNTITNTQASLTPVSGLTVQLNKP